MSGDQRQAGEGLPENIVNPDVPGVVVTQKSGRTVSPASSGDGSSPLAGAPGPNPLFNRWTSPRLAIGDFSVWATLFGVSSYVVARFMLDGFLGSFRLTFQDTGLQYIDLVFSGASLVIPTMIMIVVSYPASGWLWDRYGRLFPSVVIAFSGLILFGVIAAGVTLLVVGVVYLVGLLNLVEIGSRIDIASIAMPIALAGVIIMLHDAVAVIRNTLATDEVRESQTQRAETGRTVSGWKRAAAAGATGLVILGALSFYAHREGLRYARGVQQGKRVYETRLGLHLPGFRASPVRVLDPTGAARISSLAGRCLMLMGQRDGTVVLYDVTASTVIRLPAEAISTAESPAIVSTRDVACQAARGSARPAVK